jgi:hypothetical protein
MSATAGLPARLGLPNWPAPRPLLLAGRIKALALALALS